MPVRQISKIKRGDRVILETGEIVVKAIHASSAETARIEWHGTARHDQRKDRIPSGGNIASDGVVSYNHITNS